MSSLKINPSANKNLKVTLSRKIYSRVQNQSESKNDLLLYFTSLVEDEVN